MQSTSDTDPLVSVKNLGKQYGPTTAVDGVSFAIRAGEVVGLIGPNGAGKSTLLKALLGLIHYSGELSVLGQSPRSDRAQMLQFLSYIADVASLPEWISVKQLLYFLSGVHPRFNRDLSLRYLQRTEIRLRHKVKALSKGMKTQLHLALIMGIDARLLVLDEPTLGLDIVFRTEFYDTLANEYFNPARSILMTTHQVEEIEQYLTRVMFIHHGRILFDMAMGDIANRFARLKIDSAQMEQARQYKPIYSHTAGGKGVLIFEQQSRESLRPLGFVDTPGLAELFLAKVKGVGDA